MVKVGKLMKWNGTAGKGRKWKGRVDSSEFEERWGKACQHIKKLLDVSRQSRVPLTFNITLPSCIMKP